MAKLLKKVCINFALAMYLILYSSNVQYILIKPQSGEILVENKLFAKRGAEP